MLRTANKLFHRSTLCFLTMYLTRLTLLLIRSAGLPIILKTNGSAKLYERSNHFAM